MQILLATLNAGKLREIEHEMRKANLPDMKIQTLAILPAPQSVTEDRPTFLGNAVKKARDYANQSGMLTLADDSGLSVDALAGEPGVLSARYAGEPCNDDANNAKLLQALAGVPVANRTAKFVCAMALAAPTATIAVAQAWVEGLILSEPRGANGFGYDPLFLIPTLGQTTAELPLDQKSALSHRGQAIRKMIALLQTWFLTGEKVQSGPCGEVWRSIVGTNVIEESAH